jgi:hypothetical protein
MRPTGRDSIHLLEDEKLGIGAWRVQLENVMVYLWGKGKRS